MNGCEVNLLGAFVDGELSAADHARIAEHIKTCPSCAAEVRDLRAVASLFTSVHVDPLKPVERARLHKRLDVEMKENVDAPIWRLGGAIGLIAASILVVAGTWLAVLPASQPTQTSGTVAQASQPEQWETIASTGFVPVPVEGDHVYLADAHLEEFMLSGLTGSQP
jgi:anti-sigma factor RsiW